MGAAHGEQSKALLLDFEKSPVPESTLEFGDGYFDRTKRRRIIAKIVLLFRAAHISRLCKRFGYALTPQLLRSLIWQDYAKSAKHFPTSYLNGLRGITAVKVFTFHYTFAYSDFGFQPWGTNERHHYFLELPIIRYFYSGFTSHVFFGIAGYLTSLRLFQLLDNNDATSRSKVFTSISGSLFRRAFRLYLPVFLITLITTTYIHLGFYEKNRPLLLNHDKYFPGEWYEPKPERLETVEAQLRFWAHEMFDLTNIMREDTVYPWHDQHLWSILSEMRASLQLYGILIATAQCRKHVRLMIMAMLTGLYFMWNHWETWVYILGAMVAQIDLLLGEKGQKTAGGMLTPSEKEPGSKDSGSPSTRDPTSPYSRYLTFSYPSQSPRWTNLHPSIQPRRFIGRALRFCAFLLAFYFLSYPIDGSRDYAPGYMTLNTIIPEWMARKDKFYPNFGTAILLFLLARSDPVISTWRRVLTSPIPQYLGKISFALYLVHGPIFHAFGYMIPHYIWWSMGTEGIETTDIPWALVIIIGWMISLTVSLWAADVWAREIESRCVRLVKTLEDKSFVKRA